jgi:hypothetical protein
VDRSSAAARAALGADAFAAEHARGAGLEVESVLHPPGDLTPAGGEQ